MSRHSSKVHVLTRACAQGEKLEEELRKRGIDSKMYIGMRYWYPFTEEAVDQIMKDGITRLVVLPLYPQYSISTSGSSLRLLNQMMKKNPDMWDPRKLDHTVSLDPPSHRVSRSPVYHPVFLITRPSSTPLATTHPFLSLLSFHSPGPLPNLRRHVARHSYSREPLCRSHFNDGARDLHEHRG